MKAFVPSMKLTKRNKIVMILAIIYMCISCSNKNDTKGRPEEDAKRFELISPTTSGINFKNQFSENNKFNFLNYSYLYNGGGVAVADIDNDGLLDLYFSSNQGSNKLYLNKGDFRFEDITQKAQVEDLEGWSTGICVIDVNNDSYPDIYVCKSGELRNATLRKNKLFINQKDGTFKEEGAKWKVDHYGFSTQAYPLDYDKDGDLDLYLVNHRPDFGNNAVAPKTEIWEYASDQLFRNDGGYFTNISKQAGIRNKAWGLSASIGDFNEDTWPDIYVCNDFSQPDYLYINDGKGHFSDSLPKYVNHISMNSMGSDLADINNDQLMDLMVLDMSAKDHVRSKSNMPSMSTSQFYEIVNAGYHYQYMNNVLQVNQGVGFSEVAQMANVAKTDWSWAPLLVDLDNDGWKDLFVTNGIIRDLGNVDFRNELQSKVARKDPMNLQTVLRMVPSEKLHNYAFRNNQHLSFTDQSSLWGFNHETFSNGAAYADLDNDGDNDLIINNNLDTAFIYKNTSESNFIQLRLEGPEQNPFGIGSTVMVYTKGLIQSQELHLSRGFQSSVSPIITFGLGEATIIDSLTVKWPDGKVQNLSSTDANQRLSLNYSNALKPSNSNNIKSSETILEQISPETIGLKFTHRENQFDDFNKQLLLPWQMSKMGPFTGTADLNNDDLEDIFIGGASGQAAQIFIQKRTGGFQLKKQPAFDADNAYEDMKAVFLDLEQDGDLDIYVVSGGNSKEKNNLIYHDRLYLNDGNGNFTKNIAAIPDIATSGYQVATADIDGDGDQDILTGGRHVPWQYPYQPKSSLLVNDNGNLIERTQEIIPELQHIGMITGAVFTDYDLDGDDDLLIVGEWMPITLLENKNGRYEKQEIADLKNTVGLWQTITKYDIDNDGDEDYFLGNLGLNSKFKTTGDNSFHIYCDDFDQSGTYDIILSNSYKDKLVPIRGRECSSEQMPFIKEKFASYAKFAQASVSDIIGSSSLEGALHFKADLLSSVFMENLGSGQFKIVHLPNEVQLSPISDFTFLDIDSDGVSEIFSVGNLFATEVETTRLDASFGQVMQFKNSSLEVIPVSKTGFKANVDARDLQIIKQGEKNFLMVTVNNGPIQLYEFK